MMRAVRYSALLGAVVFVIAVIGFGLALPNYSQINHPFDVLGARGVPNANAFNLLGMMWPGLMAAMAALQLRQRLPQTGGWAVRIGTQLVFLSALGFIAMGLLPLDPRDLHNQASSWHATAWMLWWVAFCPGAWLMAWGLRGQAGWRRVAWLGSASALLVLGVILIGVAFLPSGLAQRLALAAWWLWWIVAAGTGWKRASTD